MTGLCTQDDQIISIGAFYYVGNYADFTVKLPKNIKGC